ncbi:MAG: 2OG-Fe(II) oxygenase [Alphaproteobacteria bacterium]|nr:2OG-Fe(II) oxygenase [Alphaproteobacteria bacterium]
MLNPKLDLPALKAAYAKNKRLVVNDILVPEAAERMWECMMRETPWGLVYNEGDRVVKVPAAELRAMPPQERMRRAALAEERARNGFQFLYFAYLTLDEYLAGANKHLFHAQMIEAINAPEFLGFIRELTGIPSIIKADGQATLYGPRNFLTMHNDAADAKLARRVAYVLNFSKSWNPDWGGLLQFYDEQNWNVMETFKPGFNTLSVFTVPQLHAVSMVVPYAPIGRFGMTGWFQDPTPSDIVQSR